MSDLVPGGGGRLSRREKEQRAYRLVLLGGAGGVIAVVGLVLAIVGVLGYTIPILGVIVAALAAVLFRRTVSG